jgi:hypothetical protein
MRVAVTMADPWWRSESLSEAAREHFLLRLLSR